MMELVAPDCTTFTIHNRTTTFLYKLRQPHDLGNLTGVSTAGQWTLHVSDHKQLLDGTLYSWNLELESEVAVEGRGTAYAFT